MPIQQMLLGTGGGEAPLPYANDVEYAGFFSTNASPININSSNVSAGYSVGGLPDVLDWCYDHHNNKVYSGYRHAAGAWDWPNGSNTYGTPSSNKQYFYEFSNQTYWSSSPDSFSFGRGSTIAYLQDTTPVFVSNMLSDPKLFFWYLNGTYIGYLNLQTGSSVSHLPSNVTLSCRGLAYTGTHILLNEASGAIGSAANQKLYAYDVPASASAIDSTSTISAVDRWSVPTGVGSYGLAWGGGYRIYTTFVTSTGMTDPTVYQLQLSPFPNYYNGTSNQVATYSAGGNNRYGLSMDYKNRRLV